MRGEITNEYQKLNPENQKAVSRFLWANGLVGAILLAGLIALTINLPGDEPVATAQQTAVHTQPTLPLERTSVLSSR